MLLTRLPLPLRSVRLACVRPAASVRSEPGSNSQVKLRFDLTGHYLSTSSQSHSFRSRPCGRHPVRWCVLRSVTVSCLFDAFHKGRTSARTSAVHVSLSSDLIVKQQDKQPTHYTHRRRFFCPNLLSRGGFMPEKLERRSPAATCVRRRRWGGYSPLPLRLSTRDFKKDSLRLEMPANPKACPKCRSCRHRAWRSQFRSNSRPIPAALLLPARRRRALSPRAVPC